MLKVTPAHVILIDHGPRRRLLAAMISFLFIAAVIGAGRWMESAAMQWLGFLVLILTALSWSATDRKNSLKTPQQAADWLAETYGVRAK